MSTRFEAGSAGVQARSVYSSPPVETGAVRPSRVLLVEDEPALAASLRRHLERRGFIVEEAQTEGAAVRRAVETLPHVILLDLVLREGVGASVCRQLRASDRVADVPILVLSARGELASKAELFALGADDYLVKPFDPAEMLLRVDALLRRKNTDRQLKRIGPLSVSLPAGDAWLHGRTLDLTAGERGILSELARTWPSLAPTTALSRAPWRDDLRTSRNVVEVLVGRLRRKLAAAGGGVRVRSIRRSGYLLEIGPASPAEKDEVLT